MYLLLSLFSLEDYLFTIYNIDAIGGVHYTTSHKVVVYIFFPTFHLCGINDLGASVPES